MENIKKKKFFYHHKNFVGWWRVGQCKESFILLSFTTTITCHPLPPSWSLHSPPSVTPTHHNLDFFTLFHVPVIFALTRFFFLTLLFFFNFPLFYIFICIFLHPPPLYFHCAPRIPFCFVCYSTLTYHLLFCALSNPDLPCSLHSNLSYPILLFFIWILFPPK